MEKTGHSAKGLLNTLKRLQKSYNFLSEIDPYLLTHPLPRERVIALQEVAKRSKYFNKTDKPALQIRHDMMRGKIAAYTTDQEKVSRIFKDPHSIGARYGRAIANYLYSSSQTALPMIDQLIAEMPKNPYLHEMKGEILLRSARLHEAIAPMREAVKLDKGRTGLLRIQLGHALLETNDPKLLPSAIRELKNGLHRDKNSIEGLDIWHAPITNREI